MKSPRFAQRRRVLLAGLLALPGTLLAAFAASPRRKVQEQATKSTGKAITVRLHPQAIARARRRSPLDR